MTRQSRDVELHATLRNEGISLEDLELVDGDVTLSDYFSGSLDALSAYLTNEPYYLLEKGLDYNIIQPVTYGIDFYGDCLFTTEKEIRDHPERVKAFREASLRGWQYAMAHPDEIIDLILTKYRSKKSRNHLKYEAETMKKLILPQLVELGHINPGRWKHIADTFIQFGWARPDYSLDDFIYNPDPAPGYASLRRFTLGALLVSMLVALAAVALFVFNRRLQSEVNERKTAEKLLRDSEAHLRQIIDLVPHLIYVKDEDGKFLLVNRTAAEAHGFSVESLVGKSSLEIALDPEEARRFNEEDLAVIATNRPQHINDDSFTDYLGRAMSLQTIKIPFTVSGSDSPAVLGISIDVTATKELEGRLRQARKMEAIGTLSSGIAHDFNNILQAISGYVQLVLTRDDLDRESRRHLDQVERAAMRASDLVKRLLTFGRKVEPELKEVLLNRKIIQTLNMLERTIPKMIRIETILADDLLTIKADSSQMEMVLMNLVANARDAMPEGGKLLVETRNIVLDDEFCSLHPEVGPGQYVLLKVGDTGHGMSPETLEHIFEPFFTTKEIGAGTGLGMSTVYGVVSGHGGAIVCHSRVGQGSEFKIYLPALEPPARGGVAVEKEQSGKFMGHEVVLLVDDEESILDIGRSILERHGYKAHTVNSGEKALELYAQKGRDIDLVILDLGMPGMGGRRCLEKLLALDPSAKVIIASGYSHDDRSVNSLASKARRIVNKPYSLTNLLVAIRAVLDEEPVDESPDNSKDS